jgi:recombination protein RecR
MDSFSPSVEKLINAFAKLPGIGRKTAQRLAFYVLNLPAAEAEQFANAILDAKKTVTFCKTCQNLADTDLCSICGSPVRDRSVICVVTSPKDVAQFEKTREYNGLYHVLHGTISPLNNVGPDDIKIRELLERLTDDKIREVIIATNPDTEGEATAMYLSRLIKPFGIKVTRLAYGIPVGSNLEYVDEVTLMRALEGRREL